MKQAEFQFMEIPHKILAFSGKKEVGKNHAAWIASLDHPDIVQMAFADELKKMTSQALQLPLDQIELEKRRLRRLLQDIGELLRGHDENIFIDRLEANLPQSGDPKLILITDCRRLNEAEWVRSKGGKIIKIEALKPHLDDEEPVDTHISETEVDLIEPDLVITNDWKDPELFRRQIASLVQCVKDERDIQTHLRLEPLVN